MDGMRVERLQQVKLCGRTCMSAVLHVELFPGMIVQNVSRFTMKYKVRSDSHLVYNVYGIRWSDRAKKLS
jgi:hypothetical protein